MTLHLEALEPRCPLSCTTPLIPEPPPTSPLPANPDPVVIYLLGPNQGTRFLPPITEPARPLPLVPGVEY